MSQSSNSSKNGNSDIPSRDARRIAFCRRLEVDLPDRLIPQPTDHVGKPAKIPESDVQTLPYTFTKGITTINDGVAYGEDVVETRFVVVQHAVGQSESFSLEPQTVERRRTRTGKFKPDEEEGGEA